MRSAPSSRALGTMSPTLENVSASGSSTIPAERFCTPLPTQRLPFGASSLNRMVPSTIEASEASVNRMPCQSSVPTDIRCQTMKPTPAMPSKRPATLRQVSASPRNTAASTAVNTGLALTISPPSPADTVCRPV